MKIRFLSYFAGLSLLLGACNIMPVVPEWNPDLYNGYKAIQAYQKKDTIGHTDAAQRKKDAFDCGVINYMDGNLDDNVVYPGWTDQQVDEHRIHLYKCMESKGYIIDSPENCTDGGKPTGFCN